MLYPTCKSQEPSYHPMNELFSLVYWAFVAIMAILLFPGALLIWCLTGPFDPTRTVLHRSDTGEMQRFYGGAFRLAAECACAVVPIVVDGTGAVYRDWRLAPRPGIIRIRVLDPITLSEAGGTADGLREHSWKRMNQMLMTLRGPP